MIKELTQEYLHSILNYEPEKGVFTWKLRPIDYFKNERAMKIWNVRYSGKKAGCTNTIGYEVISILKKRYLAHRLAWLYVYGILPDFDIDHINGIRNDNKLINIRQANRSENLQNQRVCRSNNKSTGLLGAYYDKLQDKFYSQIVLNNKKTWLGLFNTAIDAHNAYVSAKRELHPFGTI
jgi:hypothetical protein